MTFKIGFIGAGHHASWTLYPTLQYFPEVELACVCDLDGEKAKRVGRRFGAERFYTDYREMLDKEKLGAVFGCGGPVLHAKLISECIDRRIPLFVEKPPAPTAGELKALARRADKTDIPIMVAFMHRFAPVTVWAKKAMTTSGFGRTMMIYAREGLWGMALKDMALDSGIHHLDLMRYLCGEVQWVQATCCTDGDKRHGMAIAMWFKNGILGQLSLNSMESLSTPSDIVEIHGDRGQWLRLDNWSKGMWIRDPGVLFAPPEDPADSSLYYEQGWTAAGMNRATQMQGYVGEIACFLQGLKDGKKPEPNLWDAYRALQLVEAIAGSAKSGEKAFLE